MANMKAVEFTDELTLQPVIRPVPEPQSGELLIHVSAVGVTPTEKLWYTTTHHADGTARSKAVPGHEFSGTVARVGAEANGYSEGDAVFGLNDWFSEGTDCLAGTALPVEVTEW
jgi:NADPH:quinone reductase-like Zn-dependent oxidoreductase